MKNLEKKLRKLGFEKKIILQRVFFDVVLNGIKIRVDIKSFQFNYWDNPDGTARDKWLTFKSIKDLKKQVKEHTGVELKKKDKAVSVELLVKKYGWVEEKGEGKALHPLFIENRVCWLKEGFDSKCLVSSLCKPYIPCPTMRELKAYILKHTGEKMKKVKNAKKNKLPNTLKDQSGNGNDLKQKPIELPKRWEDIELDNDMQVDWINNDSKIITGEIGYLSVDRDKNVLPLGLGSPMLATCQLLLLRDVYRQGWKPDWRSENGSTEKFAIAFSDNKVHFRKYFGDYASQWSFQSEEIAKLFLDNFKPLLQEHYKLYN